MMVPSDLTRNTSLLFVLNAMSCASLVQIKSVPGTVPEFPPSCQVPAVLPPPHATLPNVGAPVVASKPITASHAGATQNDPRYAASFTPMPTQFPLRKSAPGVLENHMSIPVPVQGVVAILFK